MQIVTKPNLAGSVIAVMQRAYAALINKINDQCNQVLVDLGVATKTSGNLSLVGDSSLGYSDSLRKTVNSKLKTLVNKFLVKYSPFMAHTTTEFIKVGNRYTLAIVTLENHPEYYKFSDKELAGSGWSTQPADYDLASSNGSLAKVKKILGKRDGVERYLRYLNYIMRKHGIPAQFTMIENITAIQSDKNTAPPGVAAGSKKHKIRHVYTRTINIENVVWKARSDTVRAIMSSDLSVKNVSETVLATPTTWASEHSYDLGRHGTVSYTSVIYPNANIYKNFKGALKILNTLARKASYGPAVYNFRAS